MSRSSRKSGSICKIYPQFTEKHLKSVAKEIHLVLSFKCKSRFSFSSSIRRAVTRCYQYTQTQIYNIIRGANTERARSLYLSVFDVGYRLPNRQDTDTVNILLNAIVFGVSLTQDWQFYLSTPAGIDMLSTFFSDPTQAQAFNRMLASVAIFGVNDTDIFNGIITRLSIPWCEDWWFVQLALRRGLYHGLF
jgi:hypothetical protein